MTEHATRAERARAVARVAHRTRTTAGMIQLRCYLSADDHAAIKSIAKSCGLTIAGLLRQFAREAVATAAQREPVP